MSAVTEGAPHMGAEFDGVRRYRTTCKVRIDSHRFGQPIYVSDDVRSIQTAKTIKGQGQANIQLVASRNWLNFLAPNDYVNIYFNIGDGEGWTRTFFGFIDRVEENYRVVENGSPTTTYSVLCSDFYKAFERTQIYFNPHLAGRTDLDGAFFGTPNIGGLALQTSGIRVFGAPADIVINTILLLMGFGTQFTLPDSYEPGLKEKLRQDRARFVTERLTLSDFARDVLRTGTFEDLKERLRAEAEGLVENIPNLGGNQEDRISALATSSRVSEAQVRSAFETADGDQSALVDFFHQAALNREITLTDPGRATAADRGALTILNSTTSTADNNLLDVIDPITFVERRAMDGYHAGASVWQRQGPIISIIRALSHEMVNELIFDLRPVTGSQDGFDEEGHELSRVPYSRTPDEIEGNLSEVDGEQNGIKYIPAVVMREYPFSTIDGLQINEAEILGGAPATFLRTEEQREQARQTVAASDTFVIWFGEIFQDEPNVPGRHIVTVPNISIGDTRPNTADATVFPMPGVKHLDVAVISDQEITNTTWGRSDNDHFNLMEFYSDALLGTDQRFYMHDLLPLFTPIHIMRNGLRVRSLTTRFARFSIDVADRNRPQPSAEQRETAAAAEAEVSPPTEEDATAREEARRNTRRNRRLSRLRVTGDFQANGRYGNAPGALLRAKEGVQRIPYVPRTRNGPHANSGVSTAVGTDVAGSRSDNVRNRFLSAGAPANIANFYADAAGQTSITNPDGSVTERRDGLRGQAALDYILAVSEPATASTPNFRRIRGTNRAVPESLTMSAAVVDALFNAAFERCRNVARIRLTGQGINRSTRASDPITDAQFAALHPFVQEFLIDMCFGGRLISGTRLNQLADIVREDPTDPIAMLVQFKRFVRNIPQRLQRPAGRRLRLDWLNTRIVDLAVDATVAEEEDEEIEERASLADQRPPSTTSTGVQVDTTLVRRQIVRWALLNDHWYQHNLEYLNGRIEMRGAPEIRVGYRLDLYDRDMSFYVETVNHSWAYPGRMLTALGVTRGQHNNPFPVYVLPPIDVYEPTDAQRKLPGSRLAQFFVVPDPVAVRRGIVLRRPREEHVINQENALGIIPPSEDVNYIDSHNILPRYNEALIEAGNNGLSANQEALAELGNVDPELQAQLAQQEAAETPAVGAEGAASLPDQDLPAGTTGAPTDVPLSSLPGGG